MKQAGICRGGQLCSIYREKGIKRNLVVQSKSLASSGWQLTTSGTSAVNMQTLPTSIVTDSPDLGVFCKSYIEPAGWPRISVTAEIIIDSYNGFVNFVCNKVEYGSDSNGFLITRLKLSTIYLRRCNWNVFKIGISEYSGQ